MRPDPRFIGQSKAFWACVRTISQWIGYTNKGKGSIRVYTVDEIRSAFCDLGLNANEIIAANGDATPLGKNLHLYFAHRAEVLNDFVKPRLMNLARATETFRKIYHANPHTCPLPMNKQKGEKKAYAFLTGITNMLVEENLKG